MANSTFSIFPIRLLVFLCLSFCCLESAHAKRQIPEAFHFGNANNGAAVDDEDGGSLTPALPREQPITVSDSNARGGTWVSLLVTNKWYGVHKHDIPSEAQILEWDAQRVKSIQAGRAARNASPTKYIDLGSNLNVKSGSFVVHVELGNDMQKQHLIIDTGSRRTWVESSKCKTCFQERDARFNPNSSVTIMCGDQMCKTCDMEETRPCPFRYEYEDNTVVNGDFVKDKLTLSNEVLNNFIFGSVTSSAVPPRSHSFGSASGIMGLHEGEGLTVFEQDQMHRFARYFSYCLPTSEKTIGHLIFGKKDDLQLEKETSTRIVSTSEYLVKLEAISVGERRIPIDEKVSGTTQSALIDSGTVWSWLPRPVYMALRDEFHAQITSYNRNIVLEKNDEYLCYSNMNAGNTIPKIRLHFKEGKKPLELDEHGVMPGKMRSKRCLQFRPNTGDKEHDNDIIIGSSAQLTYNVIYDLDNQKITFVPKGCA